jgi:hypothetical protein
MLMPKSLLDDGQLRPGDGPRPQVTILELRKATHIRLGGTAMASSGRTVPMAQGRADWRRFAMIFVPAMAVAILLLVLTSEAVLAVSFSISGTPFTVTARHLQGQGFEQFGVLDKQKELTANAIRSATLSHLCQSVSLGGLTLRITAGDGTPVSASGLVVDADRLSGNARFTRIRIGQDAGTLNQDPGVTGQPGTFGEQAATVSIDNLRQHAFATTAGTFTLPGFLLRFGGRC